MTTGLVGSSPIRCTNKKTKEIIIMKDIQSIDNRIALLKSRKTDNSRIIAKLEREKRNILKKQG